MIMIFEPLSLSFDNFTDAADILCCHGVAVAVHDVIVGIVVVVVGGVDVVTVDTDIFSTVTLSAGVAIALLMSHGVEVDAVDVSVCLIVNDVTFILVIGYVTVVTVVVEVSVVTVVVEVSVAPIVVVVEVTFMKTFTDLKLYAGVVAADVVIVAI
jgi:hypothetical protein